MSLMFISSFRGPFPSSIGRPPARTFTPKWILCALLAVATLNGTAATVTVGPWQPIFQGIELASGQQVATTAGERNHQVLCYRVDLTAPGVELFTTPKCTNCGAFETTAENTSHFLEQYRVQVAVNGGFYQSSSGPNDVPLGTAEDVFGLAISRGAIVSPANNATYDAAFLFTTTNQAFFVPANSPPGTNTDGIYTAVSGNHPLLVNGANVQTPVPNDLDPRTALGLSQDRRYLFLMTIDGRQTGWSDGADFYNTGEWLLRFGAWDGINVDGGGSTTMAMADCQGSAVRLNRSSFVAAYGRERNIGHNFGIYARPLPSDLKALTVTPDATTATITWQTDVDATTQVEYGLTSNYGSLTPLDSRLKRRHVATLSGLATGSNYFFRAISTANGQQFTQACRFSTILSLNSSLIFDLTNTWRYTTNNLDGTNWKTLAYDDSGWMGQGPGLLYVENNAAVAPKNTALPPPFGQAITRTYYFRTHFNFSGAIAGTSLIFSNYVDDGAVFHLNGAELYRLRMPAAPAAITYATAATGSPCSGTAQAGEAATICPDVFTITGNLLTNLVQGDNVLAVETHNASSGNDLVFGSSLIRNSVITQQPQLNLWMDGGTATLFWNGEGFRLQQSADLGSEAGWTDVAGPVTQSPFTTTTPGTLFYRLKK